METASMETIADVWMGLRKHLEHRSRELNDEVAHYPTPIARCDVQLTKLLEQRARVLQLSRQARNIGPPTADDEQTVWRQRAIDLLANLDAGSDDDVEASLRARLRALLSQ
jgi:hypothetical protein